VKTEHSTAVGNNGKSVRRPAPLREQSRSSYSLSDENYEMIWQIAKRLNIGMNAAVNVALNELKEWQRGDRRFVERRKQPRGETRS
jgi:hypothetical protein